MCYNISINKSKTKLEKYYNARVDEKFEAKSFITAFAKPKIAVITNKNPEKIQLFQWGLIPHWVKSKSQADDISKMTFNARFETVQQKPSFRDAYKSNRCIVIVDSFYEWKTELKSKIPHRIFLKNQSVFALAGIFNEWVHNETGELINTVSIITHEANAFMSEIHNVKKRQPFILHHYNRWFDSHSNDNLIDESMQTQFESVELARDFRKSI